MDFKLSDEQMAIIHMAENFAQHEMLPQARQWDEEQIFPKDTLKKAAELGLAALNVAEQYGGSQLSRLDGVLIFTELARACPSTAAYLSIHNMVGWLINSYASDALKEKWLPPLATMSAFGSYCLTEPSSGSDAGSLKTQAIKDGEDYIITGAKAFISGGSTSDIYVCMVRTSEGSQSGISCVLVEKNTPGLSFGKKERKLGWHSQPTTTVHFDDCRVPQKNRIGEEGQGFKIALSALNGGRVNIAACSLGGAKQCLELTKQHLLERKQFNQRLADFQALQFRYADMLTEWEAAKWLVYRAAQAIDQRDVNLISASAMAKRYATDVCFHVCHEALQLFGGYGYLGDYPIERYFRDLRVHQILEGTNEIMRLIIARAAFASTFTL